MPLRRPIYFVSKVLIGVKTCYHQVQNLLYAVLITKWKLIQSFESHPVIVVTSSPLGEVTHNPNIGRIPK